MLSIQFLIWWNDYLPWFIVKIRHVDEDRIWECNGGPRVGTQGRNESFLASLLSLEGKKGRGETESIRVWYRRKRGGIFIIRKMRNYHGAPTYFWRSKVHNIFGLFQYFGGRHSLKGKVLENTLNFLKLCLNP